MPQVFSEGSSPEDAVGVVEVVDSVGPVAGAAAALGVFDGACSGAEVDSCDEPSLPPHAARASESRANHDAVVLFNCYSGK